MKASSAAGSTKAAVKQNSPTVWARKTRTDVLTATPIVGGEREMKEGEGGRGDGGREGRKEGSGREGGRDRGREG
jgi:hypothetical protein